MTLYDDNELRAFPLVGNDDLGIPPNVLVDVIVYAPASYGSTLTVASISVTGLVVSLVLAIDGQPAAYLTARTFDVEPHEPVDLTAILPGVSGFVAFGAGKDSQRLRLDGAYQLEPECLLSYPDHLGEATLQVGGHKLYGLVRLEAGDDVEITSQLLKIRREDTTVVEVLAGVISLAEPVGADPVPGCLRPAEGAAQVEPVCSINGVVPDCAGDLTLQVVNVRETPDQPGLQAVPLPGRIELRDEGTPCGS